MKYEIKRDTSGYGVWYGRGYPYSDIVTSTLTLWGARRAVKRHRKIRHKIDKIVYEESA